ncbi:MAG: ABC transporter substrate-binding protein [Chloroflexota bacterium]|nr:ABC transporter substrate-binding protein [Chloroflexota bacterium]
MADQEKLAKIYQRGLSRRQFLERSAALGVSSVSALAFFAACGGSSPTTGTSPSGGGKPQGADGPVKLSFFVYVGANQGVVPREVVEEYTKANPNVTIELFEGTNSETYPKMVAAFKTTPDQPIVNFGYFNADATAKGDIDGLWDTLDPANVPTVSNVLDTFKRKDNRGVAWGMVGIGLMYNTDNVKTAPTSWMDFWDSKYKGRLALSNGNHYLSGLVTTTRAQGGKESDAAAVDKAFKFISDKAKEGQIRLFFLSNDQVKQPMIRGEVWLSGWFNSSVDIWANQEKGPFGYAAPKEGQIAFTLYHQVVKGSTPAQKWHAERIINILNEKKWLSRYCNLTHSIPVAKDIDLDPALSAQEAFKSRNIEGAIQLDWPTLAAKNSEWKDRWDREVVAFVK